MSIELSFVIPTFNRSHFLRQCIDSILGAGFDGITGEIVVSDNASDDDTYDVVKTYKDPRINYFRNEQNLGIALNMIRALERARGDYCWLLSDDDLLSERAINKLVGIIRAEKRIGVVICSYEVFRDEDIDKILATRHDFKIDRRFSAGKDALEHLFLLSHHMSRIIIRRDLLDIEGAYRWAESLYPNMYVIGAALKKADGYYTANPLLRVRIENRKHWSYKDDHMTKDLLEMARELTSGEPYGSLAFRQMSKNMVKDSYHSLKAARERDSKTYIRLVLALSKLKEFRRSPRFWVYSIIYSLMGKRSLALGRRVKNQQDFSKN